jgi:hypothetical protein
VSLKKVGIAVAGTAAAGLVILGGATLADAATKTSATSSTPSGYGHPGASNDTPVTGDELAKVTAAVKAKDSAATVTNVRKDPDGSYDVLATKAGANLMYEVSADLKTITDRTPGHRGGSRGDTAGTAVTGDELAKVTAAVKAKDSAVTVSSVRKDTNGAYHVFATKAGSNLMYEVSADLKTITERQGGHGGGQGGHGASNDTPVAGDELAKVTAAVKAKDSAVTVTNVGKDPDGSYDVFATKAGSRVMYEVSADLKTITERQGGHRGGGPRPAPSSSTD